MKKFWKLLRRTAVSIFLVSTLISNECLAQKGLGPTSNVRNRCLEFLSGGYSKTAVLVNPDWACRGNHCFTSKSINSLYKKLVEVPGVRKTGAYAAMVSVMLGVSVSTYVLSSTLAKGNEQLAGVLTLIIGQLTTLGFVVVGSPIWEPVASWLRERTYRFVHGTRGQKREESEEQSLSHWEAQYFRTNSLLSLNAQMARNIIRDYQVMAQMSFQNTYFVSRQMEVDRGFVAHQVAEAMIRLSEQFPDIDPTSRFVVDLVYAVYFRSIKGRADMKAAILKAMQELRPDDLGVAKKFEPILMIWMRM